jgi:hypothetical protein
MELVTKAYKKINYNKIISDKEMGYMKNLSNAASSLTAIVNTFNKNIQYKNLSDMHQELFKQVQPEKINKGSQTSKMDKSDSDEDSIGED